MTSIILPRIIDSNCGPYHMYGRTLVVNHINYDGFIRLCALQVLLEKLQHIHTHNSSVVQNKAYCKSMYSIPKTAFMINISKNISKKLCFCSKIVWIPFWKNRCITSMNVFCDQYSIPLITSEHGRPRRLILQVSLVYWSC
jgi:hypothetical protein